MSCVRRAWAAFWLVNLLLACAPASAQTTPAPASRPGAAEPSRDPQLTAAEAPASEPSHAVASHGAWPIAAALLIGPLAHGAGHFVAGQRATGLQLLAAEGIGLLASVGGLAGLALSGASEKTLAPLVAVTAFGVGLFTTSFLADLYGIIAPSAGFGQAVARPALVAEAGAFGVIDRVFSSHALTYVGGKAFVGAHSLALEGYIALDHDNQRLRGIYALRLLERDAASYLDVELGAVHHRFAPERFSMTFAEAAISGRLALEHVAPSLHGAFVDGAFGLAFGGHRYFEVQSESDAMLLLRVGFGLFIGDGGSWTLYYDHRHDGYAAGLKLPGLASGVLGHVGTTLQYYVSPQWGFAVRAESGSAHMVGLSLLFRRKHG